MIIYLILPLMTVSSGDAQVVVRFSGKGGTGVI